MSVTTKTALDGLLKSAPPFSFEVLTGAELDTVSGSEFDANRLLGVCSCTTSACATDGLDETGTS